MGASARLEAPPIPRAENPQMTEDVESMKRDTLLRADAHAAETPRRPRSRRLAASWATRVSVHGAWDQALHSIGALVFRTCDHAAGGPASPSIVRRSRIQVPRSYRFYVIVTNRDLFEEKTTFKHIFVSGRLIRVP